MSKANKITIITPHESISLMQILMEVWAYRGLIFAFAERDLKVKYFQTILGPLWVILNPLITVGVMTFVFGLMIKVPSDDLPYLLFYLIAIICWYAFLGVLNQVTSSLEAQAGLINKIYFPRLVIAGSYVLNGTIDFLVGFTITIFFTFYYSLFNVQFILIMPLLLTMQMAWALGLGLMLAPYNARYRDIKHIIPLILQLYYFANPILYPVTIAPAKIQWLYKLNPMAVIIEAYRSCLNHHPIDWASIMAALVFSLIILAIGALVFTRKEREMVDVL